MLYGIFVGKLGTYPLWGEGRTAIGGLNGSSMVGALAVGLSFLGKDGGVYIKYTHLLDCGGHWMKVEGYLACDIVFYSLYYLLFFFPITATPVESLPALPVSSQTLGLPTRTALDEHHVLVHKIPRERPSTGPPKASSRPPEIPN